MGLISNLDRRYSMEKSQKEHDLLILPADKLLSRKQGQRELDEIRQEVKEAYVLNNEISPVSDSTYHDTTFLFEILFYNDVPMPDIGWLMDGGIGLDMKVPPDVKLTRE